ncbi:MAG: peptidoglycan DD-metalloendopeptidase family protein [Actinomycetes bacterium]
MAMLPGGDPALRTRSSQATPAGLTAAAVPDPKHPFSDPRWYPLRDPAKVSCSYKNCKDDAYHPYWAIDFRGAPGDPVHAAGSGVFHVGNRQGGCPDPGAPRREGTWVWVDHGGGVVTRYNHIATIRADEGDLVTPASVIGTMGHQGVHPCGTYYLHFEKRIGGIHGGRVDPGPLLACVEGNQVALPTYQGYDSWRDMPAPTGAVEVHSDGTGCRVPTASTPGRPAGVSGSRGDQRATLRWNTAPPGVNSIAVTLQEYHPSTSRFGVPSYRRLDASARATTFRGLRPRRPYRMRVSFHNSSGHSRWTSAVDVTPTG